MALKVNGNFELENGMNLSEVYVRTHASLDLSGDRVFAQPEFWVSKEAFQNQKDELRIRIREDFSYAYDRKTDGNDILSFANQKCKETLEGLGYSVVIEEL